MLTPEERLQIFRQKKKKIDKKAAKLPLVLNNQLSDNLKRGTMRTFLPMVATTAAQRMNVAAISTRLRETDSDQMQQEEEKEVRDWN